MTASRDRLPGLDALRGAAALGVLLFHARGLLLPKAVLDHGYLAVDLFFVISGYVLARAYGAALTQGAARGFMRRRLIRLYPMVLLGLAIGALIHGAAGLDLASVGLLIVLGALFIPFPLTLDVFPLNGPQWSLLWELVANLVYALIAPWLTLRRLVLLTLAGAVGHAILTLQFGTGSLGSFGSDWYGGGPRVVFGFFAGVLLARLAEQGQLRIPVLPAGVLVVLALLALTAPVPQAWRAAYDLFIALALFPLIVGSAAGTVASPRLQPLFDGLAGISYALYVLHIPLLWGARALVAHHLTAGIPAPALGLAAMVIAVALSIVVHLRFEPWAAMRLKNWGSRPQPRSTSLPPSITR
jgi:peptidoglycan/LPS O-acetylase OafA/YrhL